jgi:hypothetical protein
MFDESENVLIVNYIDLLFMGIHCNGVNGIVYISKQLDNGEAIFNYVATLVSSWGWAIDAGDDVHNQYYRIKAYDFK